VQLYERMTGLAGHGSDQPGRAGAEVGDRGRETGLADRPSSLSMCTSMAVVGGVSAAVETPGEGNRRNQRNNPHAKRLPMHLSPQVELTERRTGAGKRASVPIRPSDMTKTKGAPAGAVRGTR